MHKTGQKMARKMQKNRPEKNPIRPEVHNFLMGSLTVQGDRGESVYFFPVCAPATPQGEQFPLRQAGRGNVILWQVKTWVPFPPRFWLHIQGLRLSGRSSPLSPTRPRLCCWAWKLGVWASTLQLQTTSFFWTLHGILLWSGSASTGGVMEMTCQCDQVQICLGPTD